MVAVPDWEERILTKQSLIPLDRIEINKEQAKLALEIFCDLHLPDVPWEPTNGKFIGPRVGDVAAQWVLDITTILFGTFDPKTNERSIQEIFLGIPKKNGKSTLAALWMLTALLINPFKGREFIVVSTTKEVADTTFSKAINAIEADDYLSSHLPFSALSRKIDNPFTNSKMLVKPVEGRATVGSLATGTLVDELHKIAERPAAQDTLFQLRGALASRRDGFLMFTTTQSEGIPLGAFAAELTKARKIRDGELESPKYLPIIYEPTPSMLESGEWRNWRRWHLLNPNLGKSTHIDSLLNDWKVDCSSGDIADQARFASQMLNVEVGGPSGLGKSGWAGSEWWTERVVDLTLDELVEKCDLITVGLDLGGLNALLGLAVLGRVKNTDKEKLLVWTKGWAHRSALRQYQRRFAPALEEFEKTGELVIVDTEPGKSKGKYASKGESMFEAFAEISLLIAKINATGKLPAKDAIGLDRGGYLGMEEALEDAGLKPAQWTDVRQGGYLEDALHNLEIHLEGGTFHHHRSKFLDWNVSAVEVQKQTTRETVKRTTPHGFNDIFMALLDSLSLMMRIPFKKRKKLPQVGLLIPGYEKVQVNYD